jgi:serine/threonine-protein kinase
MADQQSIGRFEILDELGRGGMAVVYRARQTDLNRVVALKVLPAELARDQQYITRFLHEARSAAGLEHPHIVPVYDVGSDNGTYYIAMKYVAGSTLRDLFTGPRLSYERIAYYLDQVAGALDYAHSRNIVHRDIKPSNMLIESNGWVYLADFGLARDMASTGLTQAGTLMGTPEYMAPEQAQGAGQIGPSVDIYALAIVLYELLTGKTPFEADTPLGLVVARLQESPRPPSVYRADLPPAIEDVLMKALARRPEARYATAGEFMAAFHKAAGLPTRLLNQPQRPISPAEGVTLPPGQLPPPSKPPIQPTPTPAVPLSVPPVIAAQPTLPGQVATLPETQAVIMPSNQTGLQSAPPKVVPGPEKRRSLALPMVGGLIVVILLIGAFWFFWPRAVERELEALARGDAALSERGGLDRALAAYQEAAELMPSDSVPHAKQALVYMLRGRDDQAAEAAQRAIDLDDKNATAHALLAIALSDSSASDDALEAANEAIDLDDDLALGYAARALIQSNQALARNEAELMEQANSDANTAVQSAADETKLDQALAHNTRGYVYWQEYNLIFDPSRVTQGIEEFNKAIGLQSQLALFPTNLGYFYDAQGEHKTASDTFNAALDLDPNFGLVHAGIGWNRYYQADREGALAAFETARSLNPKSIWPYVGISQIQLDRSEFDQAITTLDAGNQAIPENYVLLTRLGWAHRSRAANQVAKSDEQLGGYNIAEQFFRSALDLNDRNTEALTGLGWVLSDQADSYQNPDIYVEAIDVLNRSLTIRDNQPFALNALGWSYFGMTQFEQAAIFFQRATEVSPNYSDAFFGLGTTYKRLSRIEDARRAFVEAEKLGDTRATAALAELR